MDKNLSDHEIDLKSLKISVLLHPERADLKLELALFLSDTMLPAYVEMRDYDRAIGALETSKTMMESLLAESPNDFSYKRTLWTIIYNAAPLIGSLNKDKELELNELQFKIMQELFNSVPEKTTVMKSYTEACQALIMNYKELEQWDKALEIILEMIGMQTKITRSKNAGDDEAELLSSLYSNASVLYEKATRIQDAISMELKALKILKGLCNTNPNNTRLQVSLSNCHTTLGYLYDLLGMMSKSITSYKNALHISEMLVLHDPDKMDFALLLSDNICNLALAYEMSSKEINALKLYEKAISVLRPLVASEYANPDLTRKLLVLLENTAEMHKKAGSLQIANKRSVECDEFKRRYNL